jgi:hypothetical protein
MTTEYGIQIGGSDEHLGETEEQIWRSFGFDLRVNSARVKAVGRKSLDGRRNANTLKC